MVGQIPMLANFIRAETLFNDKQENHFIEKTPIRKSIEKVICTLTINSRLFLFEFSKRDTDKKENAKLDKDDIGV
jgi:hypothetical protein